MALHNSSTDNLVTVQNIKGITTNTAPTLDQHYTNVGFNYAVGEKTLAVSCVESGSPKFPYDDTYLEDNSCSTTADTDHDSSYDPLKEEVPDDERTNYAQTLMNLLNGIIGSGVLSMPIAFKNGGWLLALIVTPIIGLISAYCIHLLLAVNRKLQVVTGKQSPYDYHEMAEYAFKTGPKRLRRFSRAARLVVITTIVGTQVGACCVYYVFIATNLKTFLDHRIGEDTAPRHSICLLMILPVVVGINWIRNIRYLSYLSTLSNVLQVAGISVVLYDLFSMPIQSVTRLPAVGDKIPQFFVTTLFIFEGSSVSMSLYKAIRKQRHFEMPFGVLNLGESMIMVFYSGIGFLGYLQYGDRTEGTITSSMPSTIPNDICQLAYAVVVLGTYPILLYVPIQVLWGIIRVKVGPRLGGGNPADPKSATGWRLMAAELAFRAGLVLITYVLAEIVPKLDLIISLVGSVTSSSIAVMIPSILHTVTFWNHCEGKSGKLRLIAVNLGLFTIGICAFTIGVYFSMADIVESYRNPDGGPIVPVDPKTNGTITTTTAALLLNLVNNATEPTTFGRLF